MKKIIFTSIGLIFLISCGSKDHIEIYKEYKKEALDNMEGITKGDSAKIDMQSDLPLFETYYKKLNKSEKTSIFKYEIQMLNESKSAGIPSSGMALVQDSILGVKSICGTVDRATIATNKFINNNSFLFTKAFDETYEIPVNLFIIDSVEGQTNVVPSRVNLQMQILNEAFEPMNISFYVNKQSHIANTKWYKAFADSNDYNEMITELHNENNSEIPIYITNQDPLLGRSYFPWYNDLRSKNDHILLKESTLPGPQYNDEWLGKTLIHEMGHYLGLFHTFHMAEEFNYGNLECNLIGYRGCFKEQGNIFNGDRIDDTPFQKICHYNGATDCSNTKGCDNCVDNNNPCDTCPLDPGLDPIKNYMGYNQDTCMDNFTCGQYDEMEKWLFANRNYLLDAYFDL